MIHRTSLRRVEGLAVDVERLETLEAQRFDLELDEIVRTVAAGRRTLSGFDNLRGVHTSFEVRSDNYREDLISAATGSFARQRLMVCALSLVLLGVPDAALPDMTRHVNRLRLSIYLAESGTVLAREFRAGMLPDLLTVSEYFGAARALGEIVDGIPHVDLQNAPFPDERFDVVLTSDVMEHVPDPERAEREIVRMLKPGGAYCFSAPFNPQLADDEIWAELRDDGQIVHLRPPVYHLDPCSPNGVLVYRIFSQPGLRRRFEKMGCEFATFRVWSKALGIIGDNAWIHVVRKP
jgi:SAM-dependent methyltransferase